MRRSSVSARTLVLARLTLETRPLVELFPPADALGGLDLPLRRDQLGVVERRGLDVDLAGKGLLVGVEESGAAVGAEMAPPMLGSEERRLGQEGGSTGRCGGSR